MVDRNHEELDGIYTRSTLDLYVLEKFWGFLSKGMADAQIKDLEGARDQLRHYD